MIRSRIAGNIDWEFFPVGKMLVVTMAAAKMEAWMPKSLATSNLAIWNRSGWCIPAVEGWGHKAWHKPTPLLEKIWHFAKAWAGEASPDTWQALDGEPVYAFALWWNEIAAVRGRNNFSCDFYAKFRQM